MKIRLTLEVEVNRELSNEIEQQMVRVLQGSVPEDRPGLKRALEIWSHGRTNIEVRWALATLIADGIGKFGMIQGGLGTAKKPISISEFELQEAAL
jgi:hypothetical protein